MSGCGPLLDFNADPGLFIPVASIVKSIRCEVTTYFVTNRYRQAAFTAFYLRDFQRAFDDYAFLNLDNNEYGAIDANLKTIDTAGVTVGLDWKTHVTKSGESHDWHFGPALTGSKTYILDNLYGVAQDALLGPNVAPTSYNPGGPPLAQPNKFYQDADSGDIDFFCYKKQSGDVAPPVGLETLEELSAHALPQYENFDRIFIDGLTPLAKWLEAKGADMSRNYLAKGAYMESIMPGQISYSFALDIKPSLDGKFTLVATVLSPYTLDVSGSREDTDTFTVYLNTETGKFASGGKTGGTMINSSAGAVTVWGPPQPPSFPIGEGAKAILPSSSVQINSHNSPYTEQGTPIQPQPGWGRQPGGVLLAPLPLIPPAVGPGQ
jgi:hypothetical protein